MIYLKTKVHYLQTSLFLSYEGVKCSKEKSGNPNDLQNFKGKGISHR